PPTTPGGTPVTPPAPALPERGVTMEMYNNIPGMTLNRLLYNKKFRSKTPDSTRKIPGLVSPLNIANNYGLRLTTYYVAPETGKYTFYVSGDDQCRLSISSDDDPKNLRPIVQFKSGLATRPNEWNKDPSQKSAPMTLSRGQVYYVEALMKEGPGGDHISVGVKLPSGVLQRPIANNDVYIKPPGPIGVTPSTPEKGVTMEVYKNILGNTLSSLTTNPKYPSKPDVTTKIKKLKAPQNAGDLYGVRLTAYYVAPKTGTYVFYVSGDDQCKLSLSTDNKPEHLRTIVIFPKNFWTNRNQWNKHPKQKSRPIRLVKGKAYYLEAVMKEGKGGDHLSVGVRLPGRLRPKPISKEDVYVRPPAPGTAVVGGTTIPENGVTFEKWRNIPSKALSRLITDPRFPGKPDVSKKIRRLSIRPNQGNSYGVRLTTYYVAPNTGTYRFYVAGDNQCQLSLSSDEKPENLKILVMFPVNRWSSPNNFKQ
ncbi:Hypothetical predicted protein, partial [Paramuricea clavata]